MTEKQLISKLQQLKHIKPREEWVSSVKASILGPLEKAPVTAVERKEAVHTSFRQTLSRAFNVFSGRKYAYALAAFVFVFVGMFGIEQYVLPQDALPLVQSLAEQSQASLTDSASVKTNLATLEKRSQDLAQAVKDNKEDTIPSAIKEVQSAASSLTDAIEKNPALAQQVALQVKDNAALLDKIGGTDLKQTSDSLYKTIDDQMISDLQKTTLTDSQQKTLNEINDLYSQGKYYDALEQILLIK